MKVCTFCGGRTENSTKVCTNCGSQQFLNICPNCSSEFSGSFCPTCGTRYDAPEIDCSVLFTSKSWEHSPGDIVKVLITNTYEYDLEGEEVE